MSPPRSQALTSRQLGELVAELAPLLRGRRLSDVQAQPPRDALLVFAEDDGPGVRRLRLSADPDVPRLHAQEGRVQRHEGPEGPFFRRLREELSGAALADLAQVGGDRIARLDFAGEGPRAGRSVVAELVGRNANLVLLDADGAVLDVLVPPPAHARAGAGPRLAPGKRWTPPGSGRPPAVPDPDPTLAEAFPEPDHLPPRLERGAGTLDAPLSWRVEVALGGRADELGSERLRRRLLERLGRREKRTRAALEDARGRAAAGDDAERLRRDGELLVASLARVQRGADAVEVEDWFEGGAPRRIALDPALSPRKNVERLFSRSRKLERVARSAPLELEQLERRRAALEDLAERVRAAAADPPAELEALEAEALERGLLEQEQVADERKRKPPEPRKPYRVFAGARGGEILVGRTAADNDRLTLKVARGNDVWLHTADSPGSHVVLRCEKGCEPDPEDLLDAAHLAAHFSPLRDERKVDVHVARRKQVHKPRGAKPGLVELSGGRILTVRLQPDRLRRLLAAREAAGPPTAPPGPA